MRWEGKVASKHHAWHQGKDLVWGHLCQKRVMLWEWSLWVCLSLPSRWWVPWVGVWAKQRPPHGKPPPDLPVLPSLPSSLHLVQPLHPQLCISEPVFGAADDGLQKGPGYRRSGAHLLTKKPRDVAKYRNFFLSLTVVKLASSLPSTLIFLEICRTPHEPSQAPWISSERKKAALQAEQPGTRGRLPAHGHDPPRRYRQPGTGDWQHREMIWELEEGQGKPGEVGGQMLWQGRSCGQSPGHCSRACKTCHLSRWLIPQFVKPKIFIIQLRWMQWKEARGFLAQWMRITSPYHIWGECGLDNAFYACWQQIFLIGSVPGMPVMIYHIVWRYHLLELSHLWENQ